MCDFGFCTSLLPHAESIHFKQHQSVDRKQNRDLMPRKAFTNRSHNLLYNSLKKDKLTHSLFDQAMLTTSFFLPIPLIGIIVWKLCNKLQFYSWIKGFILMAIFLSHFPIFILLLSHLALILMLLNLVSYFAW
jgi:hypothetical protein